MRNLIDEKNIENVIKYYQYISTGSEFLQNETIEHNGFGNYDFYFGENYSMWEQNKRHIFDLFGGKLKITKELGEKDLCTPSMVENLRRDFMNENADEFNVLIQMFLQSLKPQEIINNRLNKSIEILNVELKEGWKITKCFSFLELDNKHLQRQQDLYSTFLQTLNIKGRLVLSIDPLDFITMSVSRSGWSSCHHPNNCYGTGGLAYMNDSSSFIAYVETTDPMISYIIDKDTDQDYTIKMPNKIWRQVVTINPDHDYTVQMRQYPNESDIFRGEVSKILTEMLEKEQEEQYVTYTEWLNDDGGNLQSNNENLYGYIFYCDYKNNNSDDITITMRSKYDNLSTLERKICDGDLSQTVVGEVVFCACGCGDENYTNQFFTEEASDDDSYYGEY